MDQPAHYARVLEEARARELCQLRSLIGARPVSPTPRPRPLGAYRTPTRPVRAAAPPPPKRQPVIAPRQDPRPAFPSPSRSRPAARVDHDAIRAAAAVAI